MKRTLAALLILLMIIATTPTILRAIGDGQAGTTLSASVTAKAYWTITYGWTIVKSVTPDTWHLFPGDSGKSQYTITVTKGEGTEQTWVEGIVTVTNSGDVATENLKIVVQVEYKTGGGQFQLLPKAYQTIIPGQQLGPGETCIYEYCIEFTPITGAVYRVAAKITITNHSGHLGEEFDPEPKSDFELPTEPTLVNGVIHVSDTDGYSWVFSESGSVTYEKTFTCDNKGKT